MATNRTYFGLTTPQQRRLLFKVWQETGNVSRACAIARVGRRTFYHWKPRFDADGLAGLDTPLSSAPHKPHQTERPLTEQIIALRQANPTWGKRRIAHEVAKAHSWHARVSPNTVRRILQTAALWSTPPAPQKKASPSVSVLPKSRSKP